MIYFEKEICKYLDIPAIPKKVWDKKSSFNVGVAVLNLAAGGQSYAVATYDPTIHESPIIKKVFGVEQFIDFESIYPVPPYMDTNVEDMDLDEESKEQAKFLVEEANEIIDPQMVLEEPENEYFFENIHNDEEAAAYIKAYNKANRIKGRIPNNHEGLIMKLSVIYENEKKKNNGK